MHIVVMLTSLSVNTLTCLSLLLLLLSLNCAYLVTWTLPLCLDRKVSVRSAHSDTDKAGVTVFPPLFCTEDSNQKRFAKKKTFASPLVEIRNGNLASQIDYIWNQRKPKPLGNPGGNFLNQIICSRTTHSKSEPRLLPSGASSHF